MTVQFENGALTFGILQVCFLDIRTLFRPIHRFVENYYCEIGDKILCLCYIYCCGILIWATLYIREIHHIITIMHATSASRRLSDLY